MNWLEWVMVIAVGLVLLLGLAVLVSAFCACILSSRISRMEEQDWRPW